MMEKQKSLEEMQDSFGSLDEKIAFIKGVKWQLEKDIKKLKEEIRNGRNKK